MTKDEIIKGLDILAEVSRMKEYCAEADGDLESAADYHMDVELLEAAIKVIEEEVNAK